MTRFVTHGATDQSVELLIIDSADGTPETGVVFNTSGIDLWYRRPGAAKVSITEATLSALTDAHSDGGFLHISNGVYRLDVPDAAFASGASHVRIGGTVTGMIVRDEVVQLTAFDLQDAIPSADVRSLPNVWYVDDGGNDSNDGKTVSTPKLTISAAVTAASPGDTIYIGPGTYSGAVSTSKHNLTFIGDSSAATTITHNSGYTWTLTGNHCTLRNLTIAASAETSNGTALNVSSTIGTTIEQCVIDGKFDGLLSTNAEKLLITRSKIKGTYDAANFTTVRQLRCEDVDFVCTADHSTDAEFRAVVIVESNTTLIQSVGQHLFINCDFAVTRTGTSAGGNGTVAVRAAGRPTFIGCNFRARATNASYTGNVRGIVGEGLFGGTPFHPAYTTVQGGSVRCATAGSGTAYDMFTSLSDAQIHVDGANYLTSSGNVYNDGPTAALVNTAVEAGTVGTNASTAATQSTTAATQSTAAASSAATAATQATTAATQASAANTVVSSGTHGNAALKTLVDAKASQASVDNAQTDIDTIITNVDSTNSTLATMGPKIDATKAATDKLDLMIDDTNPSAPKYNEPALENAPSGGEGTEPDDRDLEPAQHVWQLKRSGDGTLRSTNDLVLTPGASNVRVAFNCDIPALKPSGSVINSMTDPEHSNDDTTATKLGVDGKEAKLELDIASDATPTDDPETDDLEGFWIKTTVGNSNGGGPIPIYGRVVIQAEPE